MQELTTHWRFWLFWVLAFFGFPIAGLFANIVGSVDTPLRAILAGAIVGATLGLIQWFVLKTRLPLLPVWWVAATSAGMAIGLFISTVVLGSETHGSELLWRGAITGFCIGVAQFLIFQRFLPMPQSIIWVVVTMLGWTLGWFLMRSIGVDMTPKWPVFGMLGALIFQLMTGLTLYSLLRLAPAIK